ncbi:hypothetical protein L6279_03720 [Candidatus Parcubacteria bacterium]|nr:hypothetical protein [Patescibacteria group bacterium]MCG2693188.1 hypothetical protein [Candidatus Parcubacteria bacterium]
MTTKTKKLDKSFKPLFWSYDFNKLDSEKDKRRIIINTVNYGNWKHWQWLSNSYGQKELKQEIKNTPASEFRFPALKLIRLLLGIKKMKYASRSDYIQAKKNI